MANYRNRKTYQLPPTRAQRWNDEPVHQLLAHQQEALEEESDED